jgi:hypothetical protein
MTKCVFTDCPFDAWHDNCCEYHLLLVDFWFYELDGVKYLPAELTFTMEGKRLTTAIYPETADPDAKTYRARYQEWAADLGQDGRDEVVIGEGGMAWAEFVKFMEGKNQQN